MCNSLVGRYEVMQRLGSRCGFTLREVPLVCMQQSSCRRYVTHLFEEIGRAHV